MPANTPKKAREIQNFSLILNALPKCVCPTLLDYIEQHPTLRDISGLPLPMASVGGIWLAHGIVTDPGKDLSQNHVIWDYCVTLDHEKMLCMCGLWQLFWTSLLVFPHLFLPSTFPRWRVNYQGMIGIHVPIPLGSSIKSVVEEKTLQVQYLLVPNSTHPIA